MNNISPILDFSLSNSNNGTLFDTRDGQTYKVVKIGNQIWLAENFRYLPSIKEKGDLYENSWVYENNNDYLDLHYGRLYDFNTAMNIAPEGWKLPNNKDFEELRDFIIKDNNLGEDKNSNDNTVGSYLKFIEGWNTFEGIINNDKYGFSAKPAGYFYNSCYFNNKYDTSLWSYLKNNSNGLNFWNLYYNCEDFTNYGFIINSNNYGLSVRLIKNS